MSQHQQSFTTDGSAEICRVAVRALKALASQRGGQASGRPQVTGSEPSLSLQDQTQRLFDASKSPNRDRVEAVIRDMQISGFSNQQIVDVCVPTIANRLGQAWLDDTASFADVTIGCARLQAMARQLETEAPRPGVDQRTIRLNCLVVVPEGAQHTLGAIVLAGQMRRYGANVQLELGVGAKVMRSLVQRTRFDAVMISASLCDSIDNLEDLVQSARCKNNPARVFIGGNLLDQRADAIANTGADYVTSDWQKALRLCAPVRDPAQNC